MEICNWDECFKLNCNFNIDIFWQSINVWEQKPHILNKKIGGVDIFYVGLLNSESFLRLNEYFKLKLDSSNVSGNQVNELINDYKKTKDDHLNQRNYDVSIRILYPKNGEYLDENIEFIVKEKELNCVTFFKPIQRANKVHPLSQPYAIKLENKYLKLLVPAGYSLDTNINWLTCTLFPKLLRWMNPDIQKTSVDSNKLVSAEQYIRTYNRIKNKYFNAITQIWSESTNPQKFIIEDIAIASYLLVLWDELGPQKFIDLGCGNGLLVYILNNENHQGMGLDVRSRKIWKSYPANIVLKEVTIKPSLECTLPNTDWIIGNHSDELTPWIPVLAAKSSCNTKFFLLPCCLFDFDGRKYARNQSNKTCYEEYLDYVEHISQICGFKVEKDRLKIPSTKRICFVGRERLYDGSKNKKKSDIIDTFVRSKLDNSNIIKLREPREKVRNCTQLNKDFLNAVVLDVAKYILSTASKSTSWREGEFTHLQDLIQLLSSDRRQLLKKECGGLQTLLKNHHHIFIVENGRVKFRKPSVKSSNKNYVKSKICWFYVNHPDSCPLKDSECSYIHCD